MGLLKGLLADSCTAAKPSSPGKRVSHEHNYGKIFASIREQFLCEQIASQSPSLLLSKLAIYRKKCTIEAGRSPLETLSFKVGPACF